MLPLADFAPLILINPSNNPPDIGCPVFVGGLVGESEEGEGGVNPSHPTPFTPSCKMWETLQRAEAGDERLTMSFFLFLCSSSYYDYKFYLNMCIWSVTKRG